MQIEITPDNAIDVVAKHLNKTTFDSKSITISDRFILNLCLRGDQWNECYKDGFIDYRVAEYVLALQKDVFSLYNGATGESVSFRSSADTLKPLSIRVKASDGSLELLEMVRDVLVAGVNRMESWQIFGVFCLATVSGFGYLGWRVYNKRVAEVLLKTQDEETKREFSRLAENALNTARESQTMLRSIVSQMKPGDKLFHRNTGA